MTPPRRAQPGAAAVEKKVAVRGDSDAPPAIPDVAGLDAEDLAAAQAGDDAAFGRLYDRHAPVVLSLCRRRALAEAEDATQETFIRAHRLLSRVSDPGKFRSWLFAIARHVCSERTRAARRRTRHEEHAAVSRTTARPAGRDEKTEPSRTSEHDEQLRRLDAAMERLDDRERLAVHLYYLESDPVRAASETLGLSRSGYYKLLGRARDRLAGLMSEAEPQ